MASEQFANNYQSTLSAAIGTSDTSLTVASATGAPASGNFRILVDSEIMIVGGGIWHDLFEPDPRR